MTKSEFVKGAKPVTVLINGVPVAATAKQFSTGSVGFNINGKVPVTLPDGSVGRLQVSGNLTLIGSKELPAGETLADAA